MSWDPTNRISRGPRIFSHCLNSEYYGCHVHCLIFCFRKAHRNSFRVSPPAMSEAFDTLRAQSLHPSYGSINSPVCSTGKWGNNSDMVYSMAAANHDLRPKPYVQNDVKQHHLHSFQFGVLSGGGGQLVVSNLRNSGF